jgi:hypothetical protein
MPERVARPLDEPKEHGMRTLIPSLAGILLALSTVAAPSVAQAHPGHHHRPPPPPAVRVAVGPVVRVVVNPWAAYWRPDPRPGWVWTAGYYDRWGRWHPGHWVPAAARAGQVWVAGYWVGTRYVDGYWRPAARSGHVWVDGDYDRDGNWREGYWKERHDAAMARERVEDRAEWREDQREAAEDRAERREDRAEAAEDRAESAEDRHEQADGYGGTRGSRNRHHDLE